MSRPFEHKPGVVALYAIVGADKARTLLQLRVHKRRPKHDAPGLLAFADVPDCRAVFLALYNHMAAEQRQRMENYNFRFVMMKTNAIELFKQHAPGAQTVKPLSPRYLKGKTS